MIYKDRHKPIMLNLDYFFIERDRGAALHLERELNGRGYSHQIGNNIFPHNSSFEDRADLHQHVRKRSPHAARSIFLLEQYGYCQVHVPTIRKISSSTAW